jgi:hypothetical protein
MNISANIKSGKMKLSYLFIVIIALMLVNTAKAQEEESDLGTQSLTIYTDFTLVLKDASRVQYLPVIMDTVSVKPEFNYNVSPTVFNTRFTPTPINAASLSKDSKPVLKNGHIKLGVGNYLSPLIDVYYNSTYQQNYSLGAYARHHSASGRSKNAADQKVFNGFNRNQVKLYGQKFFDYATLTGDLGFNSNEIFYYGYDPDIDIGNLTRPRDKIEIENQRWMNLNPKIQLKSSYARSDRINYDMQANYNYMFNITDDYHHGLKINGDFYKTLKKIDLGLEAGFVYHNDLINTIENEDKYLHLNPYAKSYSQDWQIKLGLNTTGEFPGDTTIYHFYPNILIQHNVSNTIIPYVSYKGYLDDNCIFNMIQRNPYIQRLGDIEPTNFAQVIDLGLKGNISRNLYFHINGNYSKIDNMAFFVNDTSETRNNKFIIEHSNVERFSGYGEIGIREINNLNFILKGNYYYYSYIKTREKPWHMPTLKISFAGEYEYSRDIKFGIEAFYVGKRYAKEYAADLSIIEKELKPIIDVNLYGEYSLASNFNTFIYLNNLLGSKQYIWNDYHSMGFNIMLGLKYSF